MQITDPEFELKNIPLPEREFRPYLPRTSWRCRFGPTLRRGEGNNLRETKVIRCNYSVKKYGKVTTYLSCSTASPRTESKMDLLDERKKLLFQILVTCTYPNG